MTQPWSIFKDNFTMTQLRTQAYLYNKNQKKTRRKNISTLPTIYSFTENPKYFVTLLIYNTTKPKHKTFFNFSTRP